MKSEQRIKRIWKESYELIIRYIDKNMTEADCKDVIDYTKGKVESDSLAMDIYKAVYKELGKKHEGRQ